MSLMVALAEILGTENTGCRHGTKNGQIVYKNQLVHDGNTGHLLRSQLSHHDIIQKAYQIGNGILQDHRNGQQQIFPIKIPVSDIFFL